MLLGRAAAWPDRPMARAWRDGAWRTTTWGDFAAAAAAAARGFRAAGVAAGDRVVIVSENRPEWIVAEVALLSLRAVVVPAYVTNAVEDHAHVLADSGARVAVVSTPALATRLRRAGPLDRLIQFDPAPLPDGPCQHWGELIARSGGGDDIAARTAAIGPETLACLLYTSGTGGAPRGVMLPHRCLMANCRAAETLVRSLRLTPDDLYLSILPVSHSFEHLVGGFFLPSLGVEIAFGRGVEHLAADLVAVRPTLMTVVPRVLEVTRARILAQVARGPAWRRTLFQVATRLGEHRAEGQRLHAAGWLVDRALERLVRRRVRARFGGRLRAMMSGGARLDPDTGRFFQALGISVMQGYGQTEAGPVISANPADATRIDTVGPALEGVEVRIAADGEILVRGELVMDGYWGRPEDTAVALRDGWLHTGDVGALDADGYLRITDRKKDIIVLSGGENVAPARVEGKLLATGRIAQAVVFGEGEAGLGALVVPAEGHDAAAVAAAIAETNQHLPAHERIRRHAVVEAFTLENRLLTATQKVRRQHVLAAHAALVGGGGGGGVAA
jgi:long-chain acyl-CoA synthetase